MSDDSNTDTSVAAPQPAGTDPTALSLASTEDGSKFNTIRIPLRPVDCWPLDAPGFAFDSSVVAPKFKAEVADLSKIVARNPGCPAALFGHCDPVGSDELNKTLGDRRVIAIYALLTRQPDLWAYIYDNPAVGDTWGTKAIQSMLKSLVRVNHSADDQTSPDDQPSPYYEGEADGKYGSGTTTAVSNFQSDNSIPATGKADADTRKAIFTVYMDWLCTPEPPSGSSPTSPPADSTSALKMAPADFLGGAGAGDGDLPKMSLQGCSEFNPIVLLPASEMKASGDTTQRNEDDAPNRRVIMYFFKKGTTVDPAAWPCPKVKEPLAACKKAFWPNGDARRTSGNELREYKNTRDTMACRFYDKLARRSTCESVVRPNIIKFFGRPATNDDEKVEAHRVLVPEGADVILHWETRRADSVAITGLLIDGSTMDVDIPNGGAQTNDGNLQRGQVVVSASPTARFTLFAKNAVCTREQYRTTDIVTYPNTGDETALVVGEDTIDLLSKPTIEEVARFAKEQDHGEMTASLGFTANDMTGDPPIKASAEHLLDFKWFGKNWFNVSKTGEWTPKDIRAIAKQILLSLDNYGIHDDPAGRRNAYLDIVSWDKAGRDQMAKTTTSSSSCAMFVRMYLWLLGFRGGKDHEMDLPWQPDGSITTKLLTYAGRPPYQGDAGGPYAFTAKTFRPKTGDVLYLWKGDPQFEKDENGNFKTKDGKKIPILDKNGNQKQVMLGQHMFPIVETKPKILLPEIDEFTIFSVDGGQTGPETPPKSGKFLDGSCYGVHKSAKHYASPKPLSLHIGRHQLDILNWIRLDDLYAAKKDSMKPPIEPVRNNGGHQFPKVDSRSSKVDHDADPTPTGEFPPDPTSLDPQDPG
jgi:hypothetical protein